MTYEEYLEKLHCSHTSFDEVAKSAYEGKKDYKDMRRFQAEFIRVDRELRAYKQRVKDVIKKYSKDYMINNVEKTIEKELGL